MKKITLIFMFCVFTQNIFGLSKNNFNISKKNISDTIYLKNGQKIAGKVVEMNGKIVRYNRNGLATIFSVDISEIENVKIDTKVNSALATNPDFVETAPRITAENTPFKDDVTMFKKGTNDANLYYTSYSDASISTFWLTLFYPLVGLITALATTASPVKEHNLGYQDANLMKNPAYRRGYTKEARKIKSNKVWKSFGNGLLVIVGLIVVLIALLTR
ncbi:MAG: hypothetical protein EAZ85_03380 [Bacteroidetes bacterium]|nr:MAG: hypothetical protein EAZ85_03380 [Bacteroidota bacterium]TAG95203.1 MAG: hypothetical protein EAZ20_00380 [Bacteroidota bacterium]